MEEEEEERAGGGGTHLLQYRAFVMDRSFSENHVASDLTRPAGELPRPPQAQHLHHVTLGTSSTLPLSSVSNQKEPF